MNNFNFQGKRKNQVKFSENMIVFGVVGILFILGLMITINILRDI